MSDDVNVPQLRFPKFNDSWQNVKVDNILEFISTNSFSRNQLNLDVGNVKNIHYGDIHTKFPTVVDCSITEIPYINEDVDISKFKNIHYCKDGDLIIADASEDYEDIGKSIELINVNESLVSGLHTILARDKNNKTALGFKGYLFSNPYLKKKIKIIANGVSVLGISKSNLGKLDVNLPSFEEQKKISDFLGVIDKKIELLEKKHINLKEYKKSFIQKLRWGQIKFKDENGFNFSDWEEVKLEDVLFEHKLKSTGKEEVYSVSVHKGVVNQIEHLGRSFATDDLSKYKLAKPGDIIYTKSPTAGFELGIIKQNKNDFDVLVSPLYGVFTPKTRELGNYLDCYFESQINTRNYLHPIVQKGAKNTMNITNKTFLSKSLLLSVDFQEQQKISECIDLINNQIKNVDNSIMKMNNYKNGLLQQMFV